MANNTCPTAAVQSNELQVSDGGAGQGMEGVRTLYWCVLTRTHRTEGCGTSAEQSSGNMQTCAEQVRMPANGFKNKNQYSGRDTSVV